MAVALVHARDQHLADVAREVEVDVGQRGELLVEEAPEEEVLLDRVDVREPGQVTDDRGDARAPPAAGRQQRARRVGPAHLAGHLARELEHVAVQEEEAGEVEMADDRELLLEPRDGVVSARPPGVALVEVRAAELGQAAVGGLVVGARVAVAEVPGQVEGQPLGQAAGLLHRIGMVGEALGHALGRREHVRAVAAAQRLGLVEGGVVAHGHEGVLERGARGVVSVHVAGGHAGTPSRSASSRAGGCADGRGARTAAGSRRGSAPRRTPSAGAARAPPRRSARRARRARRARPRARSLKGTRAPRRGSRPPRAACSEAAARAPAGRHACPRRPG